MKHKLKAIVMLLWAKKWVLATIQEDRIVVNLQATPAEALEASNEVIDQIKQEVTLASDQL